MSFRIILFWGKKVPLSRYLLLRVGWVGLSPHRSDVAITVVAVTVVVPCVFIVVVDLVLVIHEGIFIILILSPLMEVSARKISRDLKINSLGENTICAV